MEREESPLDSQTDIPSALHIPFVIPPRPTLQPPRTPSPPFTFDSPSLDPTRHPLPHFAFWDAPLLDSDSMLEEPINGEAVEAFKARQRADAGLQDTDPLPEQPINTDAVVDALNGSQRAEEAPLPPSPPSPIRVGMAITPLPRAESSTQQLDVNLDEVDLDDITVEQCKRILRHYRERAAGRKEKLVARIRELRESKHGITPYSPYSPSRDSSRKSSRDSFRPSPARSITRSSEANMFGK